jgi:hypothetical protein
MTYVAIAAPAPLSGPDPGPCPCPDAFAPQADQWVLDHHDELVRRTRYHLRHLDAERRAEAAAEVVALALRWSRSAARRGRLGRLTPFNVALFACRQLRRGRRFAGMSLKDVMSEAAQKRHVFRVVSIDQTVGATDDAGSSWPLMLGDALAGREGEDPFDAVRREHDYRAVLEMEAVGAKATRTLGYLAETNAQGKLCGLAAELGVTGGRVTQLKRELADAQGRHGYAGPLGPRPGGADTAADSGAAESSRQTSA